MSAVPGALRGDRRRGRMSGVLFHGFLLFSLALGVGTLVALLAQVVIKGWSNVDAVLLFEPPSSDPAIAGAKPAILATI